MGERRRAGTSAEATHAAHLDALCGEVLVGVLQQLRRQLADDAVASAAEADAVPEAARGDHREARILTAAQRVEGLHRVLVRVFRVGAQEQQLARTHVGEGGGHPP